MVCDRSLETSCCWSRSSFNLNDSSQLGAVAHLDWKTRPNESHLIRAVFLEMMRLLDLCLLGSSWLESIALEIFLVFFLTRVYSLA